MGSKKELYKRKLERERLKKQYTDVKSRVKSIGHKAPGQFPELYKPNGVDS